MTQFFPGAKAIRPMTLLDRVGAMLFGERVVITADYGTRFIIRRWRGKLYFMSRVEGPS